LEIDREATLKELVHTHRLCLHAEFEHCRPCPFVTRDRTAFDEWKRPAECAHLKEHGGLLGFEHCAAIFNYPRNEPDFTVPPDKIPQPVRTHEDSIDPDIAPDSQQMAWLANGEMRSCAFGRACGIASSGALPVRRSCITLRHLPREWESETNSNANVTAYHATLLHAACPGCGVTLCGVPPVLQHASFENFIVEPPGIAAHLAKCREYAANPRGFLLMLGSVGNGKTHLAVAIARARLPGRGIVFLSHDNFLARYRARYRALRSANSRNEEEEDESPDVLTQATEARLLIFDDLGRRHEGRDEEALLFSLFNHRYERRLPTVITANLASDAFEQVVGTALFDRIREACFSLLQFSCPSRRPSRNDDYLSP
jgi:DNA replication protein DnaC